MQYRGKIMKKFKWFIFCIILVVIVFVIIVCSKLSPFFGGLHIMNERKAENFIEKYDNELSDVLNELYTIDYQEVSLRKIENHTISILQNDDINGNHYTEKDITDYFNDKAIDSLNALYDNGVLVIEKKNMECQFVLWSSLDQGKGIIYSKSETSGDFPGVIHVEQIGPQWYYYEECMDLWLEQQVK